MLGGHRAVGDVLVFRVELGGQFAHHPVGGQLGVAAVLGGGFEVARRGDGAGQQVGVVGRQLILLDVARLAGVRQFRQLIAQGLDVLFADHHRQQVRAREVAVIVGVFLGAHGAGGVGLAVIEPRFLNDFAAVLEHVDLPRHFQGDGFFHEAERVQVLGFGAGTERLAGAAHGNVDVETHVALGHVTVADAQRRDDGMQLAGERHRLLGAAHVRFRHDFDQRRAGAVKVDTGLTMKVLVQRLTGVFFQVGVVNTHQLLVTAFQLNFHFAGADDGLRQLRGLVALGQVRIKIILPFEHRAAGDVRVHRQAETDGVADRFLVHHRQGAGHAQIDQAGVPVGVVAGLRAGAGKDF